MVCSITFQKTVKIVCCRFLKFDVMSSDFLLCLTKSPNIVSFQSHAVRQRRAENPQNLEAGTSVWHFCLKNYPNNELIIAVSVDYLSVNICVPPSKSNSFIASNCHLVVVREQLLNEKCCQ